MLNPGTRPATPPVEGLADTPYWTNRDAVQVTQLPGSLVVLGGGPIGCELAQVFARFGVRVTVVQHGDRLLPANEPEASALLDRRVRPRGHPGARPASTSTRASYADGQFRSTLRDRRGADRRQAARRRRPDPQPRRPRPRDRRPRPHRADHRGRRPDARRRRAVGDRRRHRQGRVHARVDVPERHRAARHPGRGRPARDVPRAPARHLHRSRGRRRGDDRGPGPARPGSPSASARPSSRSPTRGFTHGPGSRGLIKVVEDADRGVLVGATVVGPAGGEIIGYLAVAVHAAVPVDTLRVDDLRLPDVPPGDRERAGRPLLTPHGFCLHRVSSAREREDTT